MEGMVVSSLNDFSFVPFHAVVFRVLALFAFLLYFCAYGTVKNGGFDLHDSDDWNNHNYSSGNLGLDLNSQSKK